jgi:sulfate adenylyltransferase subunit 1 (EFTu-like GTPase family)|tara:strand:- start:67 stop:375 length:309 start_codon:yes stop_codon:yes gene_type:complete
MASFLYNISGETTQELLPVGSNISVNKISLTNTHASTTCTVDLYIEKKLTGKFHLIKSMGLPVGAAFIYEGVTFNTNNNQFSLFIKLTKGASETPTVDVIIN